MRLAITGGTGFVGSHLIDVALAAGHTVAALTRREQPPRERLDWIGGDLHDRGALEQLVDGADAVIHVAGVISAPSASEFELGNVAGTLSMLAAATAGGVRRFVHVSSLAAREPKLSLYGGSKERAEELVHGSGLDWAIVRPPAVYGPGDKETLELFKMARRGLVLLPPKGRVSLLHVEDLARLLLSLTAPGAPQHITIEPDDGTPGGWSHKDFAKALGRAVGRRNVSLSAPRLMMRIAARLDRLIRRGSAKLTPDRAAYFCHPDWVVSSGASPPAGLWHPRI
ncbi:MAG: NAD-dependent epimerase/dehydratase family protein, partial [Sphingomicrobium sp.]